jgi:glycine betaine/proline transport system ATP-binding protein
MSPASDAVVFERVDVAYGPDQEVARSMLARGASREQCRAAGYVVAVDQASLGVRAGEVCVLMGQSGCGKSSLLRSVNGLAPITRGRVLVRDGDRQVDVAACDAGTLRQLRMRRLAMVFQHFALMPWRTVRENAALGLELRGMPRAERTRRVRDALALVGLGDWMDAYPHELSGGMQQRVGLARAYVTDADILLMDEPFSALDPLMRLRLQGDLLALQRTMPRTILFVTHDVAEALKMGTRVAIVEDGRIVQTGTPEDIALRPASDYVREFVAGLNPLGVLHAAAIMRPLAVRPGTPVVVGGRRIELDAAGRPAVGAAGPTVRGDVLLRDVITVRATSRKPILVLGADDRLVGIIDEAEILGALVPGGISDAPARVGDGRGPE